MRMDRAGGGAEAGTGGAGCTGVVHAPRPSRGSGCGGSAASERLDWRPVAQLHCHAWALHQERAGAGQSEAAASHGMVVTGRTARESSIDGRG
jgi:hypothetical protein